jgi:hypothetical protein
MSGDGTLVSGCTFERDYYQGALAVPWDAILVELQEGPLFISNPLQFNWKESTPGMQLRVAFLESEDSAGAFSLPVFRKA